MAPGTIFRQIDAAHYHSVVLVSLASGVASDVVRYCQERVLCRRFDRDAVHATPHPAG